jgi:8-oxo-dGTP diphosphatase
VTTDDRTALRPVAPATTGRPSAPSPADPPLRTVGWLNVREGRLLTVRTRGKDRFFVPGGKVEPGESDAEALVREIREELGVLLDPTSVRSGFVAEAPGHGLGGRLVRMHCLYAEPLPGSAEPAPSAEIAELAWITPAEADHVPPAGKIVLDRLAGVLGTA